MALEIGKKVAKWTIILSGLDYLILALTSIFSLLIIANLQPENYAIFSIASATYIIITSILQSFFVTPFIRAVSQYIGKRNLDEVSRIFGFAIITVLLASLALTAIYLELSSFIAMYVLKYPEVTLYMKLLSINIITLLLIELFRGLLLSLKSYVKLALFRLAEGLFYIGGIYIAILIFDWTVLGIVIGTDIYTIFLCFFATILAFVDAKKHKIQLKIMLGKSLFWEAFGLGKYFIVGRSLNYIFQRWDIFVVTILVHNKLLIGYYSFAKNLIYRARVLFTKTGGLLYPVFSEEEAKANIRIINKLLKSINIIILVLVVPLTFFVALFAREEILLLTFFIEKMASYLDASIALSIFSLLLVTYALNSTISSYFNGIGEVDKQIKANIILLGSSIILIPSLTLYFNIVGAALAYALSSYLKTAYWFFSMHKKVGINLKKCMHVTVSSLFSVIAFRITYSLLEYILINLSLNITVVSFTLIPLFLVYSLVIYLLLIKVKVITDYEMHILDRAFGKNKIARILLIIAKKVGGFI